MTNRNPPTQAETAADCRRELRLVESRLTQIDGALHTALVAITGQSPCDPAKIGRTIELLQHVAQDTQPLLWQSDGLLYELADEAEFSGNERRGNIAATLRRLLEELNGPVNWRWLAAEFENLASYAREGRENE